MKFQIADTFKLLSGKPGAWWFLYHRQQLMVQRSADRAELPFVRDLADINLDPRQCINLGFLEGTPCYSAVLEPDATPVNGYVFENLRSLYDCLPEDEYAVAGLGLHTSEWNCSTRFCSACGSPLHFKKDERAKCCGNCRRIYYPRISPAIIVAIVREGKILLARSARYPKKQLFSVIAGYVEPGETLETCVQREVMEEVGIRVKNIRYFASQPWPYSGSLMIGFTADYAGGEIQVDGKEIVEADWHSPESMPETPAWGSIAGQLVEWYKTTHFI